MRVVVDMKGEESKAEVFETEVEEEEDEEEEEKNKKGIRRE